MTAEGNLIVNGALASCYASFDHDLAHSFMAPVRVALTSGWRFPSIWVEWYVKFWKWLGHSLLPGGQWKANDDEDSDSGVVRTMPDELSMIDVADTFLAKVFYVAVLSL